MAVQIYCSIWKQVSGFSPSSAQRDCIRLLEPQISSVHFRRKSVMKKWFYFAKILKYLAWKKAIMNLKQLLNLSNRNKIDFSSVSAIN